MTKPKPRGILVESSQDLFEASLSRVLRHWTDRGFAIVTAFRGERSMEQNLRWNERLKAAIRGAGFGYIPLIGYWHETNRETGEREKKQEISFLVPAVKEDGEHALEELRERAVEWASIDRSNPQESIIFAEPGGPVLFLTPEGKVDFKLTSFKPGKMADIYSTLRKRPGTFVFEHFAPPPRTQAEAIRRRREGEVEFISDYISD